jgi:DNA mismatch endonuclease (patch repair protein)|tara:strand:+ start:1294 stop:1698 length:405 start_codon:yes stop_codon:yes gene_type:complete
MVDKLSKERRSWNMRQIRSRDTKPELLVRKLLHKNGYRFRLHRKNLPGRPDIVLPKYQIAIFVHGCFWHRHRGCPDASTPKSRTDSWKKKFSENVARDKRNQLALRAEGWRVLIIWECETKNSDLIIDHLINKI